MSTTLVVYRERERERGWKMQCNVEDAVQCGRCVGVSLPICGVILTGSCDVQGDLGPSIRVACIISLYLY